MRRDAPEFEAFQDKFDGKAEGWALYLTDDGERLELLASPHNGIFNDDN